MQKRLKRSIWPEATNTPQEPDLTSPLERIKQLREKVPQAGYIRQALLIPFHRH